MGIIYDNELPIGWDEVRLTDDERERFYLAVDRGDQAAATAIVEGAHKRLYAERGMK